MASRNRQQDFLKFRNLHPVFHYFDFQWRIAGNVLHVQYHFSNGSDDFFPKYAFPFPENVAFSESEKTHIENALFHIGLCETISYWKSSCSPVLNIHPFRLDATADKWWKSVLYNGLGEFRYLNQIDCSEEDFVRFEYATEQTFTPKMLLKNDGILVPVGGGKDSVVTLELLKRGKEKITPFMLNGIPASTRSVLQAGFSPEDCINVVRTLDHRILTLNEQGYLNGHTPFSALLAFVTLLTAILYKKKYVALSNESSANEPTIPNTQINHQYSKSVAFEKDFRFYYKKYICENIEYFSFLRPLTESSIAKIFASFPQHHITFRSCNVGSKTDVWCGACSKCLFVWIVLSPYLSGNQLQTIFKNNLGSDLSLLEDFKKLSGLSSEKPFECVGTIDEVQQAVVFAFRNGHVENKLYQYFMEHMPADFQKDFSRVHTLGTEHFIPDSLFPLLKNNI